MLNRNMSTPEPVNVYPSNGSDFNFSIYKHGSLYILYSYNCSTLALTFYSDFHLTYNKR